MSQDLSEAARRQILEDAQQKLLARRAVLQAARAARPDPHPAPGPAPLPRGQAQVAPDLAAIVAALPQHQSWGSAALTTAVRRALDNRARVAETRAWLADLAARLPEPAARPAAAPPDLAAAEAILYPELALAILRDKLAAPGRLWHLLRVLDGAGRGWLGVDEAQAAFCAPDAPLRFCGARQLRNLLAQGNSCFWRLAGDRIWLRAPAKVARALGLTRLGGRPVAVAAQALAGGIAKVRAHFYASFHSGRRRAPVSRRTLAAKSGVAPRTQRGYDRAAGVRRAPNFARGPRLDSDHAERLAWEKGPACFTITDRQSRGGRAGARYLAWQLPNSYDGPHAPRSRGRQRRAQRRLADLLTKGTTGNGQEDRGREFSRAYFASPRASAQAYGRAAAAAAIYWPSSRKQFWYCLY